MLEKSPERWCHVLYRPRKQILQHKLGPPVPFSDVPRDQGIKGHIPAPWARPQKTRGLRERMRKGEPTLSQLQAFPTQPSAPWGCKEFDVTYQLKNNNHMAITIDAKPIFDAMMMLSRFSRVRLCATP